MPTSSFRIDRLVEPVEPRADLGRVVAHEVAEVAAALGGYLALVADSCTYTLTDAFPSNLSGMEIPGNSFVYDFNKARYMVLSGTEHGFESLDITPEMEDVSVSIDYSYEAPENGCVAVSGHVVSPEPVSVAGDSLESDDITGTWQFNMSGKLTSFSVEYK